eukprot:UN12140
MSSLIFRRSLSLATKTFLRNPHQPTCSNSFQYLHQIQRSMASIGAAAPTFSATAVVNGKFETIKLDDYQNKWVVLFFYPLDFAFVCPTEIIEFNDNKDKFKELNCSIIGASVDSQFTHLAWIDTERKNGGLGSIDIPLISDLSRDISSAYGCLQPDGVTVRATYIIDDKGIVRHISLNDRPVGRNVNEILRLIQGFQHALKHGDVCPVNWNPGDLVIKPDPYEKLKYFQEVNETKDDETSSNDDSDDNDVDNAKK